MNAIAGLMRKGKQQSLNLVVQKMIILLKRSDIKVWVK